MPKPGICVNAGRCRYNIAVTILPDWGLNPATFQVLVAFAAFLAAGAAILAARAAKRQAEVTALEVENRNRPWIGLTGLEHSVSSPEGPNLDQIRFSFVNHGSLPCDRAHLMVEMWLEETAFDDEPIHTENMPLGTIFPNETAVRSIQGPLAIWTITFRVGLSGRITYYLGNREYVTRFTGELDFSRDRNQPTIIWQNTEAVFSFAQDLRQEHYH